MTKAIHLTPKEIDAIKSSIFQFDKDATIYLFGSRTNPNKKGMGEINAKRKRDNREFIDFTII